MFKFENKTTTAYFIKGKYAKELYNYIVESGLGFSWFIDEPKFNYEQNYLIVVHEDETVNGVPQLAIVSDKEVINLYLSDMKCVKILDWGDCL